MAYFKLMSFSIWKDNDPKQNIEINENDYNNLKSFKYELNDYRDIHYDPPEFFNYITKFN